MKMRLKLFWLIITSFLATIIVSGLFGLSERIIHHHNNFIRRFPQHVSYEKKKIDLVYNSYYFAGADKGEVYLGNATTPLYVTAINVNTGRKVIHKIQVERKEVIMQAPRIKIIGSTFFLYEGLSTYIFKGSINDWKGHLVLNSGKRFTILDPIDSLRIALRYEKSIIGEGMLGILDLKNVDHPKYSETLLQGQGDAFFDTDGNLAIDRKFGRLIYTYYYRNQYIVTRNDLVLDYRGNTIDTVSKADIKLATIDYDRKTFAKPPLTVNRLIAADSGLLFVNSMLPGEFDEDDIWKSASIIDVYDLKERTYRSSFPIYHLNGRKMKSFLVDGNELYALIDTHLVCYGLRENLKAILKNERKAIRR